MKCDNCGKPATVHLTEIKSGKKIEKHLCEACAAQTEGVPLAKQHTPINELLTNFVMAHSGLQKDVGAACELCGITWAEFRQSGLLGCEHDYERFEKDLTPLLQRAHGLDKPQETHHVGKSPVVGRTAEGAETTDTEPPKKKKSDAARLRKELQQAIEREDYERAAKLRDQIRQAEE